MDYDIFVSYRRTDAKGNISGRDIARLLSKEFKLYGYKTFFDYSELKDNDFALTIIPAVENCKIFILVLTKDSLVRCSNTDDWVRQEIKTAIDNSIKIITVNPDNAFNGWPEQLPKELSSIKTIQMSAIDMNSNFEVTVKRMISDRILPILPRRINVNRIQSNADSVSFRIGQKDFTMPDQFFNESVYKSLKRSYVIDDFANQ